MSKGRVTIPTDESFVEGTKAIAALWGADAVRDCDGTELPKNVKKLAEKVYNTYFIVRGDNEWAEKHPEETHRTFLMSARNLAESDTLQINPMQGYFALQIQPDWENTAYWEVYDRTSGERHADWEWNEKSGRVLVKNARPMHEYTVNFMAKVVWHPVQIYNYLTNQWACARQKMYDPAFPHTALYIKRHMEEWCRAHPETDVVRFTTFLYQFMLVFNEKGKEKYVDWFGYGLSTSPAMLEAFAKEYGYALCSEDFVRAGNYNSPFRNPDKKFRDWTDFVQRKVSGTVRELVDIVHSHGKEAMMFLGDDWIGAEPYGKHFKDMDLDAVVGSVGGGVTVRMLSEIPHVKYREGRLLPYFFPDTFFAGNEENAVAELNKNWMTARRALLRKPLDRLGFGGYLSLAAKFPQFVARAGEICEEFRTTPATLRKLATLGYLMCERQTVARNPLAGRRILFADATRANGFLPMPDEGTEADIIYICSPNNPTGAAYSVEQLQAWVDYANARGAIILYDAAYERFVAGEGLARSIFETKGAEGCAIEFCSLSKTAGFTGTRCGYTVVPHALVRGGVHCNKLWLRRQTTKFNGVSYIVQRGAEAVFTEEGRKQIEANLAVYRRNAQRLAACLDELGVFYTGGKNSPYLWLECPGFADSWKFFDYLLEEANVVGTPGSGFGKNGEGFFRLTAFASEEATEEAAERILALFRK